MKIVFDNIIFGGQKIGGISTVWYELISRALRDKLDVNFIDFPDNGNILREQLGKLPSVSQSIPSKYKKIVKYLPVIFRYGKPFIFHSSFFRFCSSSNAINITTIHDFTNELFQTGTGSKKERWIKNNAINHSDYIICISQNTKKDFENFYPSFPKERIRVIYNGVSDDFYVINSTEWHFMFPRNKYIIFVGNRDGYKNFNLVIDALTSYNVDLVIVGAPLTDLEREKLQQIKGEYHYAGRVSCDDLNTLYNGAIALVYPSAYEGFGLPILEAQKAGCPVIALNSSSIPEVIGNTPLLMDNPTKESICNCLDILKDQEARKSIINEGIENAKRFSWEKMYLDILSVYSDAYELGKLR